MSSLTPLQLKQIEENRLAALKRRQEKQKALSPAKQPCKVQSSNTNVSNNTNNFIGANSISQYVINKAPDNVVTLAKTSFYNSSSGSLSSSNSLTKNGYSSSTNYDYKSNNKSTTYQQEPQIDIKKTLLSTYVTGTCRLISSDRFAIDVPFHQQLIDYFKTVPNKMYDAKERKWNFPLSQYSDIMNKLNQFKPEVTVNPLPHFLIKAFLSKNTSSVPYTSIDISCISSQLRNQLYPFQVEGIQFAISKKGRCLIADEMGLGKTIQALGVADYYKSNWPLLIVCPSSMRYQWEEDVRKYIPDVPLHQIFVMKNSKEYIDKEVAKVLIVSYDLLGRNGDFFKSLKFGISIVDESHSLKSSKTRRTRAALEVLKNVTRVILLSGTPAVSRPIELYTQIVAIETSRFATVQEYGLRYCDGKKNTFGWDFTGSSNMDELKIVLESKYMIRRLKTDVLSQLPSKIRQVVILNSDDIKAETQSMKAYSDNLSRANLKGMERRGQLLLYFAETAKVKLKAVCDYIMKLLEEGKKFLCFAHHQNVLDGICETLHKCKTEYIRIDGKVGTKDRKNFCDKFQFEEKYRVAVLSLRAANVGLTLTSAQLVVFAELFWNPGDLTQAEDRAHRIGQQDSVLVQYLLAKKTADDYLWPLVQDKLDVLGQAGLTKDTFVNSGIKSLTYKTDHKQQEITDFFKEDDLDEENLSKLMDEIDGGGVEKKIKLM